MQTAHVEVPGDLIKVVTYGVELVRQFLKLLNIRYDWIADFYFSLRRLTTNLFCHGDSKLPCVFLNNGILNIVQPNNKCVRLHRYDFSLRPCHKLPFPHHPLGWCFFVLSIFLGCVFLKGQHRRCETEWSQIQNLRDSEHRGIGEPESPTRMATRRKSRNGVFVFDSRILL